MPERFSRGEGLYGKLSPPHRQFRREDVVGACPEELLDGFFEPRRHHLVQGEYDTAMIDEHGRIGCGVKKRPELLLCSPPPGDVVDDGVQEHPPADDHAAAEDVHVAVSAVRQPVQERELPFFAGHRLLHVPEEIFLVKDVEVGDLHRGEGFERMAVVSARRGVCIDDGTGLWVDDQHDRVARGKDAPEPVFVLRDLFQDGGIGDAPPGRRGYVSRDGNFLFRGPPFSAGHGDKALCRRGRPLLRTPGTSLSGVVEDEEPERGRDGIDRVCRDGYPPDTGPGNPDIERDRLRIRSAAEEGDDLPGRLALRKQRQKISLHDIGSIRSEDLFPCRAKEGLHLYVSLNNHLVGVDDEDPVALRKGRWQGLTPTRGYRRSHG
ncbi:MAG: hypothetical protein BWX50_00894 [Euryarchaeota archaeon ADurb.Bin009]|nr:MAG: hypothetical protein BWX50_00894 [Euryarchaeota archaeon ADurb.Bin009]